MTSTTPPNSTVPPGSAAPSRGGHRKIPWEKIGIFAIIAIVGGVVGGFVGYALHSNGTAVAATGSSSSCSIPKIADQGPALGRNDQRP